MTASRLRPSPPAALLTLLGALALGQLSSCDNPACVFGTEGCQIDPEQGANQVAATFPETGEWTVPGRPTIERIFPSGEAKPESPIVLVFSETISPATIDGAFSVERSGGIGGPGGETSAALVGDGRVLVLIPPGLIGGEEYQIILAEATEAQVADLSGAVLGRPEDGVVGTFTVTNDPPGVPDVLMTWPYDGSASASPITEVVTVFDRLIDPTSVTPLSWDVQVEGVDPEFDPAPELVTLEGGAQEPRIWTWHSIDTATGERAELGQRVTVSIDLSTDPDPALRISTVNEERMEPDMRSFSTNDFGLPIDTMITSVPDDAIGIENLSPTGSRELTMGLDFDDDTVMGDVLEIFIVGSNPDEDEEAPPRISKFREVNLEVGAGPYEVTREQLGLLQSSDPLVALFEAGDISFAFAMRRGELRTPLQVLDVDPIEEGVQDAFIDLEAPSFGLLIGQGLEDPPVLVSDLRELSVIGNASDKVRSVLVTAQLASGDVDNLDMFDPGVPPLPVEGSNGFFVAAPVDVGVLDPDEINVPVEVRVYDRALNPSDPATLSYTQRGASGIGLPISSGFDVEVTVFDSQTLAPISSALVYRHESVGGVLQPTPPLVLPTNASGRVDISPAAGDTLITVEAAGYHLFTYQGVPTTRLDVPLEPELIAVGLAGQTVVTPGSALTSPFLHPIMADSRVFLPGDSYRESTESFFNPFLNSTESTFGQIAVRRGEVGLLTFLATKDPADVNDPDAFSAGTFLQAFELDYPRVPLSAENTIDVTAIQVAELLSGAGVDPIDIPLGIPGQVFFEPPNYDIDFAFLEADSPRVSVEAFTYGVRGMMTIGMGLGYEDAPADRWDIRAAYSARARVVGELAGRRAIEDERYLKVELVGDTAMTANPMNRTGVRIPLSSATGSMTPPGVPLVTAPVGDTGGSDAYDVVFENVLTGPYDQLGIYRLTLQDVNGRRWIIWQPDPPAASGPVVTHVPPISVLGGVPLAFGQISAVVEGWAWSGFDAGDFFYTDVPRRHEAFTSASPKLFLQGP